MKWNFLEDRGKAPPQTCDTIQCPGEAPEDAAEAQLETCLQPLYREIELSADVFPSQVCRLLCTAGHRSSDSFSQNLTTRSVNTLSHSRTQAVSGLGGVARDCGSDGFWWVSLG